MSDLTNPQSPTKAYTPAGRERAVKLVSALYTEPDRTLHACLTEADVPAGLFHVWMEKHPDLAAKFAEAKVDRAAHARRRMLEAAEQGLAELARGRIIELNTTVRDGKGMLVTETTEQKYYPPNPAACIHAATYTPAK